MEQNKSITQNFLEVNQNILFHASIIMGKFGIRERRIEVPLHHYTTAEGLRGILENRYIFATHSNYLNDISEINYGQQLIRKHLLHRPSFVLPSDDEVLRMSGQSRDGGFSPKQCEHAFEQIVDIVEERFERKPPEGIFVTSFCLKGNLLSQWRGYGSMGGYSIMFTPGKESEFPYGEDSRNYAMLHRVLYQREKQNEVIRSLFDALSLVISLIKIEGDKPENEQFFSMVRSLASKIQYSLNIISTRFKHPSFSQEHEVRITTKFNLSDNDSDIKKLNFRSSTGVNVPFVKIPLGPSSLELAGVRCGPTLPKGKAKRSVELMLKRYGYPDTVEVKESAMPLAW